MLIRTMSCRPTCGRCDWPGDGDVGRGDGDGAGAGAGGGGDAVGGRHPGGGGLHHQQQCGQAGQHGTLRGRGSGHGGTHGAHGGGLGGGRYTGGRDAAGQDLYPVQCVQTSATSGGQGDATRPDALPNPPYPTLPHPAPACRAPCRRQRHTHGTGHRVGECVRVRYRRRRTPPHPTPDMRRSFGVAAGPPGQIDKLD